jgi:hypothetical protein
MRILLACLSFGIAAAVPMYNPFYNHPGYDNYYEDDFYKEKAYDSMEASNEYGFETDMPRDTAILKPMPTNANYGKEFKSIDFSNIFRNPRTGLWSTALHECFGLVC